MRQALRAARAVVWLGLLLTAQLNAAPAIAGPFARLQVLLPGETAAPGTSSGKTGTPNAQTAGIPFYVTVNACDPLNLTGVIIRGPRTPAVRTNTVTYVDGLPEGLTDQ